MIERVYKTEWYITDDCHECDGMGWFESAISPWSGDTSCPVCDGTGAYIYIETCHENEESVRADYPNGKIEKRVREVGHEKSRCLIV